MRVEGEIKELGSWVARTRIQKQITQAVLARRCGVAKRTLERFEQGESVGLATFIKILRELDLLHELMALAPKQKESPMAVLKGEVKIKKRVRAKINKAREAQWIWGEDK